MKLAVNMVWVGMVLALVAAAEAQEKQAQGTAGETVTISFEQREGFPPAGGNFTGRGIPQGIVTAWTNDSAVPDIWFTHNGPGGVTTPYAEAPAPITGAQVGGFGAGGSGITTGTMELNKSARLTLTGFHWAWRGNGNTRPGGNAWLELEYFDLRGISLGREKFHGGLDANWNPKFDPAKPAAQFQAVALYKVVFRGVPPDSAVGQGSFYLEDMMFAKLEAKPELSLVRDGKPACAIVVPKDAGKWTMTAAQWLQEYVRKASGAELKIVAEDQAPSGTIISVGHTRLAEKAGIDVSDLKYDGCKLLVKGDVLYLIGRDSKKEIKSDPLNGAKGTCRAVLTFLEDFCGVRWFLPGSEGELVPKAADISVPRGLSKTFIPAFAYSTGRFPYDYGFLVDGGGTPGAIINNYRYGVVAMAGGHVYYGDVPAGKYFKEHPEYFALINGKRTGEGNHLCTSNPDVRKLLLRAMQEKFDKGYEWVTIGQEDGYLRCQCPECEKLDNYRDSPPGMRWEDFQNTQLKDTPCERLFLAHKWVIDEVRKSHPDRKVLLMCYAPTAWPSKVIDKWPDNVIGELMNQEPAYIEAWRDKVAGLVGYVYWFNVQCPMGFNVHATAGEMAEKIRYLHTNHFVGLYQIIETNWGFQGPVFYVVGKLMGDPSLDYKTLVKEYCDGVFGKAGNTMLEFFNLLYGRLEKVLPLPVEDFAGRNTGLPKWITTADMYLMQYPPEFLNRLDALLKKAEQEADTERNRGWVKHTREYFDFTNLLTRALISYRAWQSHPTKENWLEMKEQVEAFDAYRMKIINYPKSYTDVWFPGYDYFCNWMTADCVREHTSYYTPWEKRKPDVLKKGIKGTAMGHGDTYYSSHIKEPLTLDFSKEIRPVGAPGQLQEGQPGTSGRLQ